jgi:ATP-dependent helicase/nuclease subunit B
LETLGRCPHQYLLKYVLNARVPDQPAGPDTWLAPHHRGTLLHRVFDRTLKQARDSDLAHSHERFFEFALGMLDKAADEMRAEIAPPSEMVFLRERDELRRDLRVWVASLGEPGVEWVDFEMEFGPGRDYPPVLVQLPNSEFWTLGAIDRVDRLPDGSLRIVDYKTGSPNKYARKTGIFDGGRRLQHFIYSQAAEALLDAPVDRMEYRFPSERGKNDSRTFTRAQLASGAELIDGMLNMVARGHFLPTETSDDCRFCDHGAVCRIRRDARGNVVGAPLAEWAAEHAEAMDAYEPLLRARTAFN